MLSFAPQQERWVGLHGGELHRQQVHAATLHHCIHAADLQDLGAIEPVAHTLADNLCSALKARLIQSERMSRQ